MQLFGYGNNIYIYIYIYVYIYISQLNIKKSESNKIESVLKKVIKIG